MKLINSKSNVIYALGSNFKQLIIKLLNTIYYVISYNNNFILVNCWVSQRFGKTDHRNFGDELNIYLIEALTKKKVVNQNEVLLPFIRSYMVIGSLVEKHCTKKTIIWGSGAISGGDTKLSASPMKVCAVRGKLTRNYLLNRNVQCPEIFGDPALLLPFIYKSETKKKYKIGIIPHVVDLDTPLTYLLGNLFKESVHIISFKNYKDWRSLIDEINSCEYILSSSLHGLIISDAYGIPNIWIKISENLTGGNFKFLDYFSGVERNTQHPYVVTNSSNSEQILELLKQYKPIRFNIDAFLNTCPFNQQIII